MDYEAINKAVIVRTMSGDLEGAVSFVNKVLDDDPNAFNHDFKFWHNLGVMLFLECRYNEAIKFYEKSLDINEKAIVVWCDLGEAYEKINDFKEAISCYNKVYELDQIEGENLINKIIKGQMLSEFSGKVKIGVEKIR